MRSVVQSKIWFVAGLGALAGLAALAQAPNVPVVGDRAEINQALTKQANSLRKADVLLSIEEVQSQLSRKSCQLALPQPGTKPLEGREVWRRARESYLRTGWHYLCRRCDNWHLDLAGGFFITSNGVIATASHVIQTNSDMREAYLIAATEDGKVLPVTEVLADNPAGDTCILRLKVDGPVKPLPLNSNVYPGDRVWCYSDPLEHAGFFSSGVINRFQAVRENGRILTRIDVSTDWAPGSSGAAVLDDCGNAIGLVSEIEVESRPMETTEPRLRGRRRTEPLITLHHAARAAEILSLVKPPTRE